jgi:DNA-binding CsgD family transcriptional regulator
VSVLRKDFDTRFRSEMAGHLRDAFDRSPHPMLLADDQRRWVTANAAACELLAIGPEEVPWRSMDDFTPPSELRRLEREWSAFLASGEAEGWYDLYVPGRGAVPVEFSAVANLLPSRHLALFIPPDSTETPRNTQARQAAWSAVAAANTSRPPLTKREGEIMTLVASGLQTAPIAERLVVTPATVSSHVQNAMTKLGAHTRAHAVAIALVTGQITWKT